MVMKGYIQPGKKKLKNHIKSYRDGITISSNLAVELNQMAIKFELPSTVFKDY